MQNDPVKGPAIDVPVIPPSPDVLPDRVAIEDLVARFDDAMNRRDKAEFQELWIPEASWEIGEPRALKVEGRDAIVAGWETLLGQLDWLFRASFVGVVSIDGDEARGHWPCVETGTNGPTNSAPGQGYDNRAYYEDRYVRRNGAWYFARRRYHYLWLSTAKLPGAGIDPDKEFGADP